MTIPIDVIGDIVNSEHSGHCVRVVDDSENTGGILIYQWWSGSNGPNADNAFDAWVLPSDLEGYFRETGWQVHWRGRQ